MNQDERMKLLRQKLSRWYARHGRDLPWRGTRDPYAVWVSEIMLQQTQVATVKPYFKRFMKRFPNVRVLSRASLDEVLKCWEGLGYYGRARNMHTAARRIARDFDGKVPQTTAELLTLPGVGRYTASAIASIAFGRDEPVLDGNVTRVLCRVFRIRTLPKETGTQKKLWKLARKLMPAGRAGRFNQALMDLGATVCTPRTPGCLVCPLRDLCGARARGEEQKLPVKAKRKPLPHHDVAVGIVWKGNRVLIDRRKPEGLLGGLWEFPGGRRRRGETLEQCVLREIEEELGVKVHVRRPLVTVKHAYTHFRVTLHAFECDYVSGRPKAVGCAGWKWVALDKLDDYAFPTANRRVMAALRARQR